MSKLSRTVSFALPWLLAVAAVAQQPAQQSASQPSSHPACQTDTIDWVLPGHFDDAVARAKAEKRLILIKGVSFGIDEMGARCATKGKW